MARRKKIQSYSISTDNIEFIEKNAEPYKKSEFVDGIITEARKDHEKKEDKNGMDS